jgi:hypothetical protein
VGRRTYYSIAERAAARAAAQAAGWEGEPMGNLPPLESDRGRRERLRWERLVARNEEHTRRVIEKARRAGSEGD